MARVSLDQATHPRCSRVLLCAVDPHHQGGVAEYYRSLRPYFSPAVDWFVVGSRPGRRSRVTAPLRALRDTGQFLWKLRDPSYAVVHLNPSLNAKAVSRDAILLVVAKCMRRKVLVFFHGWDAQFHALLRRRFSRAFCTLLSLADGLIVLSNEFRDGLKAFGIKLPVTVETTVVGEELISQDSERPSRSEADPFRILFLSRIERYKGVYEALEAFRALRDRYQDVRLCIAGEGSELEQVRRWVAIRHVPDTVIAGHLTGERKAAAFRDADVFVLPTYGEGMPISVLEAMVMGLPVVTCRTGGIKDFFQDGTMGVLLERPDVTALVKSLEVLRQDPDACQRMGDFNRTFALERFTPLAAVQRLEELYGTLGWSPSSGGDERGGGTPGAGTAGRLRSRTDRAGSGGAR